MKLNKFFSLAAALLCATTLFAETTETQQTLNDLIPDGATNGTVISVPAGTYAPSDLTDETRTLIFQAEEKGSVILDGAHANRCADLSDTITLDGFVIQNGLAECGGGVRGGTVVNSTIKNCSADFGGGAYKTNLRATILVGNTAEFFGMAAYGGTMMSCRVEGNASAAYGGGMGALFGVKVANTSVTGNSATRDFSGALVSDAQNMIFLNNTATKGLYEGAPMKDKDLYGGSTPEDYKAVSNDATIFTDAAAGDYTLKLTAETEEKLKEQGDSTLGDNYDDLWYNTDLAGRPRLLGTEIDIGPYEIAKTFTVTCDVEGVGQVALSKPGNEVSLIDAEAGLSIQEGDDVIFTASTLSDYSRKFDGFYVNGERVSTETEMTMTYAPVESDVIVARFKGLTANTDNLSTILDQIHDTIREVVTLEAGAYEIGVLSKNIVFMGTSIDSTTITATGANSTFVNVTVSGTLSGATIHRSLLTEASGANLTITSSVIASDCTNLSGKAALPSKAANVTAYGDTLLSNLTCTDCLTLTTDDNTVAGAILGKGHAAIDDGENNSGITPYDNYDIAGRPRVMGEAIDLGAHECHYITLTVKAEGYYTELAPAEGEHSLLAGDKLPLTAETASPREFKGWTLENGTAVESPYTLPTEDVTLTATFSGFEMAEGDDVPTGTTARDTITLAAGTYGQTFDTPAKIVGTGVQGDVILTGTVSGGAKVEAVTLQNATLGDVTLNRCRVNGVTMVDDTVAVTATNSIFIGGSVKGAFTNNTFDGTEVSGTQTNCLEKSADAELDYQLAEGNEAIDAGETAEGVGALDYYGNPRINNGTIDKGAAEYQWPPYVVTINVIGHGLVSPRGTVNVIRGETLTFTAKEDPEHTRGNPTVVGDGVVAGTNGSYTVTPSADMTITVTFAPITVAEGEDLAAAVAEAQNGDTITVDPGTYGAIDVKGKAIKIVASSNDPAETIIDAQGLTRAVNLADGAEIIGFTIQNGVASEGAGVNGGVVRRCVIKNNALSYNGTGAGISNVKLAESCLIYDNGSATVARSNGGGAANSYLLNCTVARNTASTGAGLYECTAKNCVVALNADLSGVAADWYGETVTVDPSACCTPIEGSNKVIDATTIFVAPELNDWRLREGVACIDLGTDDKRLSEFDAAGNPRKYNDTVDMGALEWNSPDYQITIDFHGPATVTATYGELAEAITITEKKTLSVPRDVKTITFAWASAGEVDRTFKGIFIDGESVSEDETTAWTIETENTVYATLVFTADDLAATTETVTATLADATPGETVRLEDGIYTESLTIGENVTVIGDSIDGVILQGGATLASGAVLTKVSATAPIVGPTTEGASAELSYAKVYGVTGDAAAVQNLVVKTVLVRDNVKGIENATVYLSTIVNNSGYGVNTSMVYGSALWNNGENALESNLFDSYTGAAPAFTSPEEDNYTLTGRSALIDFVGTPAWEGFDVTDFATDLADEDRPSLFAYDAGAYEYQAPEDAEMTDYWTWYGNNYDVDGNIGDAVWTRMQYGAPQQIADGDAVHFVDRTGFASATIGVDKAITVGKAHFGMTRVLNLVDAGGHLLIDSLTNASTGTLNLAGPLLIGNGFASETGKINILDGAEIFIGGIWQNKGIPVTISGGTISTEKSHFGTTSSLMQTGGTFNFGTVLELRDTATATFAGGTVTGGRISVAQGGRTAIYFTGADVTVERLETGDTSGARYGNIEQTGGTVKLIGTATEKNAPLHISHWPGESHYYLKGGELIVPNSEVRLGRDGNGRLHIEGGVAKLKSVAITGGAVFMKGGTYHALATQTLKATQEKTSTYEAANGTVLTLNLTTTAGTTTKLASGSFKTTVPNNVNLTLGTNVALEGNVALGAYTLTLPGNGAPTLTGDYTVGSGTITIDSTTAPALNTKTAVLKVTGTITGTPVLVESQKAYYTLEVADGTIYVTRTADLPEETTTETTPTLTVTGDTTWETGNWSSDFVAEGDAIVKVVSDGTLSIDPEDQVKINTLTFDIPEGVTLKVTATTAPYAAELVKKGQGTLCFATPFNYVTFDSGEGIFVMAAEGEYAGAALNSMALVAEADISIESVKTLTLTIADGKIVTLKQTDALSGTIIGEGDATIHNTYVLSFKGTVDVAGTLNGSGSTLTLSGDVAAEAINGSVAFGTLNALYLGSGSFELNNTTLADCFEKAGAGSITVTETTTCSGSVIFGGPVTLTNAKAIKGALHFREGAVVTMPSTCTWTSTGEIRVEPTVSFVLTGTPAAGTYTLLTNELTVGLQTDDLASLAVAWETAPSTALTTKLVLENSALKCVVTEPSSTKTWTGATDSNWSTAANWSDNADFVDGDAVVFNATSAGENTSVELSKMVAPSIIAIESGTFTIDGGENGYGFDGNVTVTQAAGTTVTWETFMSEGSYTIYANATATIAVSGGWTYKGHFVGGGRVVVQSSAATDIVDLTAPSVGFTGTYAVEENASLRLSDAEAAYNATVEVAGSLKIIAPATVRTVEMKAENASITVGMNWPLTVRESITGYNGGAVKVAVSDMPKESGDWEIMYLPEGCATKFVLADEAPDGYATFLSVAFNKLYLSIRPDSDIAWGEIGETDTYGWVINGTKQAPESTADKNVYLNELDGVVELIEQAMPESPLTLTVKAKTTKYKLTGNTTIEPTQITLLPETSVTLAVPTTPVEIANAGTLTIENATLDLTETTLSGHGKYIVGTGATILVPAQKLAETTAKFERAGGEIQIVVADGSSTLPDGNYPTGGNGTLTKIGSGTLHISPTVLANSMDIRDGSVVMTAAAAIKARYVKFEPHARFAAASGSLPPTGLSDFVMTLNGQRLGWSDSAQIVRFDSGVDDHVLIGIANDEQKYIATDSVGEIESLFDNNPATQFIWRDWHATYGLGTYRSFRQYFVLDAGEAGVIFTGYNVATPASLPAFFYKWDVSIANDISVWRPHTNEIGDISNENTVWQDIDIRENSESYSSLTPSSWMSAGGYTAQKLSGLYSNLSGAIKIAAGAELNLEKLAGTTGILPDVAVLSSVKGTGTLTIPSNLTLDAETIDVGTLKLVGSAPLEDPFTAKTTLTFNKLELDATYEQALLDSGNTDFFVATGFTGTAPTVSSTLTLGEGESWATEVVNGDLYLYLVSSANVYATVNPTATWDTLTWTNAAGTEIKEAIDWKTVETITLRVTAAAYLSGLPEINETTMPALTAFNVDFGYTTTKPTLMVSESDSGSNEVTLPELVIKGKTGGVVKTYLKNLSITTLTGAAPYNGVGVEILNALTASSYAYTGSGTLALYGSTSAENVVVLNKKVTVPAAKPLEIAGGIVKLSKEENFGAMVCDIQVNEGATLDVNGCPLSNDTILAGGTLTNTGAAIGTDKRQTYNISLTANSTISGTGNFMSLNNGWNWHKMELNGYTLTKSGSNTFAICNATIVGAKGTIRVEGGEVRFFSHSKTPTTNFQDVTLQEAGGEITIEKNHPIVGTLTLDGDFKITNLLSNGDTTGNTGNLVVAENSSVEITTAPTYTGTTTVESGATFGAPSVAGALTFESGATFKPLSNTTAMSVGGTLTSSGTTVNLESAKAAGALMNPLPLIATACGQELTADMVAEQDAYKPSASAGTIYYNYADTQDAYYWNDGEIGAWNDNKWLYNNAGNSDYLSKNVKVTFDNTRNQSVTLKRTAASISIGITPVAVMTIPSDVTVIIPEADKPDYALTINGVSLMAATSVLQVSGSTLTLGTINGAGTFITDSTSFDKVTGSITANTKLTGSTLPTTGPANLTCSAVTISEEILTAIRATTSADVRTFILAQATSSNTMPKLLDENGEVIPDYVVTKGEHNKLYITVNGDPTVTAVKATVSGTPLTWSELIWTDIDGNVVKPVWRLVKSVSLTATGDAMIAIDVDMPSLTSLNVSGAYDVGLMPKTDERVADTELALTVTGATLYTQDLTAATTSVSVASESSGIWQIINKKVPEMTGTLTVVDNVTLQTMADLTLVNLQAAATVEVLSGNLTLTAAEIAGNVTIAKGATLTANAADALVDSTESDKTLVVNGTLNLDGASWRLSGWTVQMGAGATITGMGATVDGQTLALNCATDTTVVVTGANATLSAPIGTTVEETTLTISGNAEANDASLTWEGEILGFETVNVEDSLVSVTLSGAKAATGTLTVDTRLIPVDYCFWAGSVAFEEGAILELGDSVFHVAGTVSASGLTIALPDNYTVGTPPLLTSNASLTGNMFAVATVGETKMSPVVSSSEVDGLTTYALSYKEGVVENLTAMVWSGITAWDGESIFWQNQDTTDALNINDLPAAAVKSVTMAINVGTVSVATPIAEIFPNAKISIEVYSGAIYALTVAEGETATVTETVTGSGKIQKLGTGTLDLTTATIAEFTGALAVEAGRVILAQGSEASIASATCAKGAEILIKLSELAAYEATLDGATIGFLTPDGKEVASECVSDNTFTPLNLVRDGVTYVNIFRGTRDETDTVTTAETATAWYTSADKASWTAYATSTDTLAPLLTNSDLTNPVLFDGTYMPTIAADAETGRKVVAFSTSNTTTVEGYGPTIGVYNNVDLTINKLNKLQLTSRIDVDETSKLTLVWNEDDSVNVNGTPTFYIKSEEGLIFTKTYNINGASTYYLYEAGSVKYATVQGTHTIAGFTLDLGEGDYPAKETRQLIAFTSSSATFNGAEAVVTATDNATLRKVASVDELQDIGDYVVTTEADGVYVSYIKRNTLPSVYIWTGGAGEDANWITAANWEYGIAPSTPTDDVVIPAGFTVTLPEDITVGSLTISPTDATTAAVFSGEGSLTAATTAVNGDLDVSTVEAALGAVTVAEGKALTVTYNKANQQYTSLSAASGSLRVANDVPVADVTEINAAGTWIVASGTTTTLPAGSNDKSVSKIKVESGATLDINGCYDLVPADVILADGAIWTNSNSENPIPAPAEKLMYENITLEGGTATISGKSFSSIKRGHADHFIYLNGGTLDFAMDKGNTFYFTSLNIRKTKTSAVTEETGTLQVTSGTLQFGQHAKAEGNTNLVIKSEAQVTLATDYYFGSLAGEGTFNINNKSTQIGALNTDTVFTGTTSSGTLTKVGTGTLDMSKATINSTTFAITGGTLILPAGKEGTIFIPAETTVQLVLNEEQLATEYISSATGDLYVTFVKDNGDGTYTEVIEGVNGNVYSNPTVPAWIPATADSLWNNADYWTTSTVPTSGDIRVITSNLAADIDVTIPAGYTSVEVEAHSSHTTKLAMASDATHPTITASGKVAFTPALLNDTTHVNIDGVTTLVIDTDEAETITRDLAKTIVTTGTGTATISGVISGANTLTVETGTLVLTGANTLTGQVIVQEGATLDITAETARLFSANWFNPGNRLRVFGTLRTRPWYYSQSLGAIGSNSGNVRLLGGTVEFPAGSDETGDQTRGFVVESTGATFVVPAGFKYSHRQPADTYFGITNNGTLTLTGEGSYQFNGNVSGTVSVAAGTTLAGQTGTFTTLTLANGVILDASTAAIGATTLTALPDALTVKLAERPGTDAVDFLTTTTGVTEATPVEGTTLTLVVGEMADSAHYELVKTATGYGVRAKGICAIGDDCYPSLEAALDAVKASVDTEFTITLYDEVALAKTLVIDVDGKTVTLDLYGAAMTTADAVTPAIRIAAGTLKVVSSAGAATITAATDGTAILVGAADDEGTASNAACVLDVGENVTVSGTTACQVVAGTLTGAGTLDGAVTIASAGSIVLDGTRYLTIGALAAAEGGISIAVTVPDGDSVVPAVKLSSELTCTLTAEGYTFQLMDDGIYYACYSAIESLTATLEVDTNISEIEWTYTIGEITETVKLPDAGYYPCTLTATTAVTVTMDTDAAFLEKLTIADGSKITLAGESKRALTVATTEINADFDVSAIDASLGAVTLAEGKTLSVGATNAYTSIASSGGILEMCADVTYTGSDPLSSADFAGITYKVGAGKTIKLAAINTTGDATVHRDVIVGEKATLDVNGRVAGKDVTLTLCNGAVLTSRERTVGNDYNWISWPIVNLEDGNITATICGKTFSTVAASNEHHLWQLNGGTLKFEMDEDATFKASNLNLNDGIVEVVSGTLEFAKADVTGTNTELIIRENATVKLTMNYSFASISGEGTLHCVSRLPSSTSGLTDGDNWTGTVKFTNVSGANVGFNLPSYGNANSRIVFDGVNKGYLDFSTNHTNPTTCTALVEVLENASFTVINGWNDDRISILSKLTGAGTWIHNPRNSGNASNDAYATHLQILNISEFRGSLQLPNTAAYIFIGDTVENTTAGNIILASGETATISEGKTWSVTDGYGIEVRGTIGGSGTIAGNLTLNPGATLDATAGALTVNTVNWNGAVVIQVPEEVDDWATGVCVLKTLATDLPESYTIKRGETTLSAVTLTTKTVNDVAGIYADSDEVVLPKVLVGEEVIEITETNLSTIRTAAADLGEVSAIVGAIISGEGEPVQRVDLAGLELFENVDVSVDAETKVATISYAFGITEITVQSLEAIEDVLDAGTYVVLTVKVDNGSTEEPADYGDATRLIISMNGKEVNSENVTVIEKTAGVMKLAIPYESEVLATASETTSSETFTFTVRATNEAE